MLFFFTDLHGDGNKLFTQVMRNERLLAARSSMLCIEFELHKDISTFENYLDLNFDSKDQWIEDAIRIVRKCDDLKKDGYHGDKLLSMCPTNLHSMAIFNDSTAIKVNTYNSFICISYVCPLFVFECNSNQNNS